MSAMLDAIQGRPKADAVATLAQQLIEQRAEAKTAREVLIPCIDVLIACAQGWRQEIREGDALRGRVAELEDKLGRLGPLEGPWSAG